MACEGPQVGLSASARALSAFLKRCWHDVGVSDLHLRPAVPADAFFGALLLNSTNEPHFATTAAKLASALSRDDHLYVVSEAAGRITGLSSCWLPAFHPAHAWIGLHLHPDHLEDETACALLAQRCQKAREQGRSFLWASLREDYRPSWPDLAALGFREVHRTFGGGFHLRSWASDTAALEARLTDQGYRLEAATPFQNDARLPQLYALTREDKVAAPPTIPPAADRLADEDALWSAAFLAWSGEELVGLALPERSRLEAWNAVLTVHPEHRRRGLGTALLVRVARSLQAQGLAFLNVAGSARDSAYLGVLRWAGANVEPDWIAFEREV